MITFFPRKIKRIHLKYSLELKLVKENFETIEQRNGRWIKLGDCRAIYAKFLAKQVQINYTNYSI